MILYLKFIAWSFIEYHTLDYWLSPSVKKPMKSLDLKAIEGLKSLKRVQSFVSIGKHTCVGSKCKLKGFNQCKGGKKCCHHQKGGDCETLGFMIKHYKGIQEEALMILWTRFKFWRT